MPQKVKPEVTEGCATCKARASCIFFGLAPEQFKRFATIARRITRKKDEIPFWEGEIAHGIYILRSGQAGLLTTTEAGKSIIVGIAEPGDILGAAAVLAGGEFTVTAKAMEPCELEYVRKDDFLKFLKENPDLQLKLMQKLGAGSLKLSRQIAEFKGKSAIQRLEHLLLDLCETCGEPTAKEANIKLKLTLSGEELAELVGISREWASKLVTRLKRKGIIKVRRGKVLAINKAAFERDLG
jgi:CRP/FNR family transcriptional regulator